MNALSLIRAVALAYLLWRGSIFAPLRERGPRIWRELVACPLCLGVWVGLIYPLALAYAPTYASAYGDAALCGTLALTLAGAIKRL